MGRARDIVHNNNYFIKTVGSTKKKKSNEMVILRRIPRILSPQLLNVLARMGHGDEIVLADANFPSASVCRLARRYCSDQLP